METWRNRSRVVAAIAVLLFLSGCGKEADNKPVSGQVIAKVDGNEISVHQLNSLLANQKVNSPEAAEKARQSALTKLVDQQLAYNQALEQGLDRNANVVLAIENAKRELIARAYLEQVVAGLSTPSEEDIRKYYDENPELFAERKVYRLQEIAVEHRDDIREDLRKQVDQAQTLDDIGEWLKENDIKFRANAANRAAEQIGMLLLQQVAKLKDGEITLIEGPSNYLVVRLAASQEAPVTEEKAGPRIARFLHNIKVQETISEEIKRLKSTADIQYGEEFASLSDASSESDSKEDADSFQSSVAQESSGMDSTDDSIQKGLQSIQ